MVYVYLGLPAKYPEARRELAENQKRYEAKVKQWMEGDS